MSPNITAHHSWILLYCFVYKITGNSEKAFMVKLKNRVLDFCSSAVDDFQVETELGNRLSLADMSSVYQLF